MRLEQLQVFLAIAETGSFQQMESNPQLIAKFKHQK